jgi:ArsR family transcriptional regulator, lead/cadmium/zinc/bismuth-responsive transcriptional repressor
LAWIAERSQNLVSHHLRALRVAGLVASRRDGKMVLYALTAAGRALLETVLAAERATVQ